MNTWRHTVSTRHPESIESRPPVRARRLVAYGEPAFDAVANPRLHHQLVPSILYAENWSVGGISFNYSTPLLAVRRAGCM